MVTDPDEKRRENRNHLRAWREHRKLSQDELAKRVGTNGSTIWLLEEGDRALSPKWLRKLAPELGTTAGHLLDYPPEVVEEVADTWAQVDPARRAQALEVLRTFTKKATG